MNEERGDYVPNESGDIKEEGQSWNESIWRTGYYQIPHALIEQLLPRKVITKSEYILLDYLLHFENRYKQDDDWFYVADETICTTRLLSSKTLVKARRSLKGKGLIDTKKGYSNHATEYRILIGKQYYYRGGSSAE
jgi:hypothetical protein